MPPIHTFYMGEEVAIGENIFMDDFENMNGYTVTVNNTGIMPLKDALLKYSYEEGSNYPLFKPDVFFNYPEMVSELHLTIRNTNLTDDPGEHSGINFINYILVGTDYQLQINDGLYLISNPSITSGFTDGFRLRPNSKMDFYLPCFFRLQEKWNR